MITQKIGPFGTRKAASERLAILDVRGLLKFVGFPSLAIPGHPPKLYSNYSIGHKLTHDYHLAQWRYAYWPQPIARDESELRSDGVIDWPDFQAHMEMDEGTESEKFLRKRLEALKDCPHVLFCTTTVNRAKWLMEVCKGKENVFIAPLSAILADPYGMVYVDPQGKAAGVPNPS